LIIKKKKFKKNLAGERTSTKAGRKQVNSEERRAKVRNEVCRVECGVWSVECGEQKAKKRKQQKTIEKKKGRPKFGRPH